MKHTKLMILGLTAAMTLGGATTIFADEITDADPETAVTAENSTEDKAQQKAEKIQRISNNMFGEKQEGRMAEIDMSSLELPEGFVPFDENHVPDGQNAPEKGELKPIAFDADGNMIYGQKPEGMPPMMFGERPELPEGEMPAFDGEHPELPEGEMPDFDGERPELPAGEMPAFDGERPELPEGEMPAFDGERPELPEGEMPVFDGELPEFPENGNQPLGYAQRDQRPVGQLTSFFR